MSFLKPKAAKSSSLSENVNNGMITSAYGGQIGQGTGATNYLSSLLGVNTDPSTTTAANNGYQSYLQQAGYAPAMAQLSKSVTGQGAAAGLLNSGSTGKALQSQGAQLNNQYFNNYLQQLSGLSGLGLQAGGLVANTGQRSTGTNTGGGASTAGSIASTVGGLASLFSDRRMKTDIRKLGTFRDGLGWYSYRYKTGNVRHRGVMAQEVAKLRPWALGPIVDGFQTVHYSRL